MDYPALAKTILGHPLTWVVLTLVAAPVSAAILNFQLRALGLARRQHERKGIAWNLVLSFLLFWVVLTVGLASVASHVGLEGLSELLYSLFSILSTLIPASIILAGASHYRRTRLDEARDQGKESLEETRAELRWIQLAAGTLAAIAVVNGPLLTPLILIAGAGAVLWWITSASARARTRSWLQSWSAGKRLRSMVVANATVEAPQGRVSLVGPVGLLTTDVLEEGQMRPMPNGELLERVMVGNVMMEDEAQ